MSGCQSEKLTTGSSSFTTHPLASIWACGNALIGYLSNWSTTAARPGLVEVTSGVALSSASDRTGNPWPRCGGSGAGLDHALCRHAGPSRVREKAPVPFSSALLEQRSTLLEPRALGGMRARRKSRGPTIRQSLHRYVLEASPSDHNDGPSPRSCAPWRTAT